MNKTFVRLMCAGFAFACLMTAGTANAQLADRRTFFTFSQPIAIPGVTLPAGTYLFRLMDNADVAQVLSADGKKPYAMFFIHRALRPDATEKPEVRFLETASGMPAAVHTWWYPGERSGFEFVYPKAQAERLAKGTGEPVLTTTVKVPATVTAAKEAATAPPVLRIEPSGQETPVASEPQAAAVAPPGHPLQGELAPASIPVTESLEARATLPRTASEAPLVVVLGVGLLFGAIGVRAYRFARV